jgi:phosphoribosylanthranilate isomerase
VTVEQVAAIVPQLPGGVEKIGVFVDAAFEEIARVVSACELTGLQLHSDSGREVPAELRARFGRELRILRVIHFGGGAAEHVGGVACDTNIDGVLVDSRTATAVGGTGVTFDWTEAAKTLFRDAGEWRLRLVAAGGLKPENVADAISILRPWGVDVVSGVETAPGRKDPDKVRAFVANARAAELALA